MQYYVSFHVLIEFTDSTGNNFEYKVMGKSDACFLKVILKRIFLQQ